MVEDHDFQRQVALSFLAQLGVRQVIEAADGREALDKIRGAPWPVDVALCDLDMPGMDGVQFIRHLAEDQLVTSVILQSGLETQLIASVEGMARAHGLTVLGTIEKPVTAQKLYNLLSRYKPGTTPRKVVPPSITPEDIRRGLAENEFVAYYQPKVEFQNLKLAGVEALARWRHKEKGLLAPATFIDVAERNGLIDALTMRMLETGFTQQKTWAERGLVTQVAINLSLAYLGQTNVADVIFGLAARLGVSPKLVTLEVTESLVTTNLTYVLENLARLRMRGFGISIDDYGTGFSSMQQLSRIPFTELKIDQSFVTGATNRPNLRVILESSLQLAHKLGLKAVAEGIEKDEEWALLKSLDCDVAQGYFIARPMPGDAVLDWNTTWSSQK
ncbi:MAG TPA: EAL domain-containing response regulator [Burkholderiales bacterium]|nr:EAL domain-containing response regulator [Burkholderiales bacterium]